MTTDISTTPAPLAPTLSQGTAIEQSRAIAEVQAMVVIAQNAPRSVTAAVAAMRESCSQKALAERAFFRFPRAGQQVTGPSIHLARELARVWGNLTYGITELRRDDTEHVSEMLAYAWDVQTNTRSAQIFIVPHAKDTKQGRKNIVDLRDIYENNANQGARRVREAIFAVLPTWFTEEAKAVANQALQGDTSKPLSQRIADALKMFADLGITEDQIVAKFGERATDKWTAHDIAALSVIYTSIKNGEVHKDDEFPPKRITASDLLDDAPAEEQG